MVSAFRQRVFTALLIAVVVIGLLAYLPASSAVLVIGLVFLGGAWEWAAFAGLTSTRQRTLYVLVVAGAMAFAWSLTSPAGGLRTLLWITVAWWLAAAVWIMLGARRGGRRSAALAGFIVLVPAAVALGRLVLVKPNGPELLLFLIVLVAAADVGAFFGGRRLGRHKLAPFVSPGKTWEGLISGMLAAIVAAIIGGLLLSRPLWPWLAVCLSVALLSVVGDLVESMFKRHAGLKDSGSVLPGHGGVLDRIDSLTAAGPAFVLAVHAGGLIL